MRYKTQDFSTLETKLIDNAWSVFKDSGEKSRTLKLDTIATHSGKRINKRVYPGVRVKDAIKSFKVGEGTAFEKPFLRNHDQHNDAIGRIKSAEYKQTATGKKFLNDHFEPSEEGTGFVKITSVITDQDAIEKFLDGRYQTVSIGGTTDGAFCNICSKTRGENHQMWTSYRDSDGVEQECRHIPGKEYNDTVCHIFTGALEYHEVSQVNVPADNAACHLAKTLVVNDSMESSLWGFFDSLATIDFITVPARFAIVDAEGNTISGLDTDTYKSNKTISIPDTLGKSPASSEGGKSTISDKEFATCHVLKHFSDLGMITLTDAQKVEVTKLKDAALTQAQSGIMSEGFMIHPSIPFKIYDEYHYKAVLDLLAGDIAVDKELYKSAVDEAAKSNNFFKDNTQMDAEALKKALDAATAKVTSLEADLKAKDASIADTQKKLTEAEASLKAIADSAKKSAVEELIALRTELKLHDTKELAVADKKEATLKALTDKYAALDASVLKMMIEDMKAQKLAIPAIADQVVENPLTVKPEASEAAVADAAKPAASVKIEDLKPAQLL